MQKGLYIGNACILYKKMVNGNIGKAWYLVALPNEDIDVPGYNPVVSMTRVNRNSPSPRRNATSNVIANEHRRELIGLVMHGLDDLADVEGLGDAGNYAFEIPTEVGFEEVSGSREPIHRKRDTRRRDLRAAQELEACHFLSSVYGGNPRGYLEQVRKLFSGRKL